MSVNSEAIPTAELPDDVIQKQRWIFNLLSESQAETILNEGSRWEQARASKFLVSSLPSSRDYRISIRQHKTRRTGHADVKTNTVEHIIISYNEEDQSYGIESESNRCQSVVEVVREYVASRDYALEPFSGSLELTSTETSSKPVLMSITSIESSQIEEPPAYNTAMQYPTDKRSLPQIKTKLDLSKAQEAKLENSFSFRGSSSASEGEEGCCYGACDSGYDPCCFDGAGWLRVICLGILFGIVAIFCGCCLFIIYITLACFSDRGICDKCGPWCGCEDFCEEHFVCCDDD